jgi:hypothetical protein
MLAILVLRSQAGRLWRLEPFDTLLGLPAPGWRATQKLKERSMAKSKDAPEGNPESSPAAVPSAAEPQSMRQQQVQVDDTKAIACYANFCRVTGTPEEVILDLGLNTQPFGTPTEPIAITQRITLNYFTAKRMLAALQLTVQRHEAAFGVLETDVQKRVRQPGR